MSARLAHASAALGIHTGGGEVLDGAPTFPPTMAATESWPPNAALATRRLHPRGVVVVVTGDQPPLPFADEAFDLVTSRHPIAVWWSEIARLLRPGGTYFAQHPGPATVSELVEFVMGPHPELGAHLEPAVQRADADAAGLQIVDMRMEKLRAEFFDIGAVVYFLRKLIWTVPDFTVEPYTATARTTRTHRDRRPIRDAPDAGSGRSPLAVRQSRAQPSSPNTSSACCRSAGYGLTNSTHRPSAGWANANDRACSH